MRVMIIATLVITLFAAMAFWFYNKQSKTEPDNYKLVVQKFEGNFNDEKFDAIFNMFSDGMQRHLPLDSTKAFFERVKRQSGSIVDVTLEEYRSPYAIYKTKCEKDPFTINISVDNDQRISGLFIKPFIPDSIILAERNVTPMELPFKGEWTVFWGGSTKEQNRHIAVRYQRGAFDLVITDASGKTHKGSGEVNDDYYAFDKEIFAPCDGEIVSLTDGIQDNKPGTMNRTNLAGNSVLLKTVNNEFLLFAHFKEYTVAVKQGQRVRQGEFIGRCGNSGNSSEPHLHFHIQNAEDIDTANGVKCYFNKLLVNGVLRTNYSPVKGDKIQQAP